MDVTDEMKAGCAFGVSWTLPWGGAFCNYFMTLLDVVLALAFRSWAYVYTDQLMQNPCGSMER